MTSLLQWGPGQLTGEIVLTQAEYNAVDPLQWGPVN